MTVDLPMPNSAPERASAGCATCAVVGLERFRRFGLTSGHADTVVALAGNPNTGKSTVFNAMTGMRQHVGNWPGTTVSRAEGRYGFGDRVFKVVDLPGAYSLLSTSSDEDVARDFLLFGDPDVTVVVVDATRLERNLNLVLQIMQITGRVIVALNLIDEAERHRIDIDVRHLSRALGVAVVPMSARRGEGVSDLLQAISECAQQSSAPSKIRRQRFQPAVEQAIDELVEQLDREFPGIANARWVALRLLEGDTRVMRAVNDGTLGELVQQQTGRLVP